MGDVADNKAPNPVVIIGNTSKDKIEDTNKCLNVHVCNPISSAAASPCFSNKLRHDIELTPIALTSSFQTIFLETGKGKLVGFVLDFTQNNVTVKLTIDGNVIFDVLATDILDIQLGVGNTMRETGGGPVWQNTDKKLGYIPLFPVAYDTDVKIEAKEESGPGVTFSRSIVNLTKEP